MMEIVLFLVGVFVLRALYVIGKGSSSSQTDIFIDDYELKKPVLIAMYWLTYNKRYLQLADHYIMDIDRVEFLVQQPKFRKLVYRGVLKELSDTRNWDISSKEAKEQAEKACDSLPNLISGK
uniref:Uncharacterized protein n=1 Tax=Aliivibrio fischeri TaxID=668 RepID=H2ERQ4_ALIFS|nr:hypothetical protein [Aliivibrio fischeri]AEY78071.1 hypothetical protein [Aliivibrio fischeri]